MITQLLGLVLALGVGAACRILDIPAPAPPQLFGALLVAAITLGFITGDWLFR